MKNIWKVLVLLVAGPVLIGSTAIAACDSPVLPVVEGASWTYRELDSGSTYTQQISNVTAEGFTMIQSVDGESFEVSWTCGADGLLAVDFSIPVEGFSFETIEASGVTFPSTLAVGDSWNADFVISGSMSQEGMDMSFSGHSVTDQQIVRRESVTVPAGTWEAFVIEGPFTMTMSASFMGMTMPIPTVEGSSTTWIVEGVGMVRSSSGGFVTELVEFSIP